MQTNTQKIAISLPKNIIEELDKLSKEQNYSKSFLIRIALDEYLKTQKGGKS